MAKSNGYFTSIFEPYFENSDCSDCCGRCATNTVESLMVGRSRPEMLAVCNALE